MPALLGNNEQYGRWQCTLLQHLLLDRHQFFSTTEPVKQSREGSKDGTSLSFAVNRRSKRIATSWHLIRAAYGDDTGPQRAAPTSAGSWNFSSLYLSKETLYDSVVVVVVFS